MYTDIYAHVNIYKKISNYIYKFILKIIKTIIALQQFLIKTKNLHL